MLTASRYRFNGSYASSLKTIDSSIVFSEEALERDPANDALWNDRGVLLYNFGLYDEALTSFEQSIALNPRDDSTWYNKGNAYFHLNYLDQAIASYDQAIALHPGNSAAWSNRGCALSALNRLDEAIASYNQAIDSDPQNSDAWNNRGSDFYTLRCYQEALCDFNKAVALKPDEALYRVNQGNALRQLRELEKAFRSYDSALLLEPKNPEAQRWREVVLEEMGKSSLFLATVPKVPEQKAQAIANLFLSNHLPDRFTADQPDLVAMREAWDVPVILAYPHVGSIGRVGVVVVSTNSETVLSHTPIEEMKQAGQKLYKQNQDAIQAHFP